MGLVVLSLCDGISTGQYILNKLGMEVDKYYSSEIDKNAMKVTNFHFPKTIQIGDIRNIEYRDGFLYTENGIFNVPKVDIILSGTPCVSFSVAGKKENMDGLSGELFMEFHRIMEEVKPTYFFFENVKMSDIVSQEISEKLKVEYTYINSVDFGCHIRKRYYWTNIPYELEYTKKNVYLKDIIDNEIPFKEDCSKVFERSIYNPSKSHEGVICINPRSEHTKKGQTNQRSRIYDIEGKCPTICASLFDLKITKDHKTFRKLTIEECELLQGLPKGYTSMVSRYEAGKALGNGWQVDTVSHILKTLIKIYNNV